MREHQSAVLRLEEAREKHAGSTRTWRKRSTRWRAWASKSPPWTPSARHPTAKPRKRRSNWRRARSGCGSLHARLRQIEDGRQERTRALADGEEQLTQCILRAEACRWNILRAESDIAELYIRKEAFAGETVQHVDRREALQRRAERTGRRVAKDPRQDSQARGRIHAQDLAANELRHERTTLVERLREDYGIELADAEHQSVDQQEHGREAVQAEIDDLRQKINAIGSVNLEALEELHSLEARHENLSRQFKDLSNAKAALEKIIEKINTDSRRLFSETLQTVREHFQSLFRDLFGGGHADIVLEEAVDILESGVEIVARPPGKEPRSISLLSGGEKTLTCVALLLAIFRSRPSPFCVLDEVDAALDEANIDRFTKVLRDFLAWTQFIIVTHSKKTMTCADTIYGVTMQESGVSKQVSVRFEDVSDDGHILYPAARGGGQHAGGMIARGGGPAFPP